MTCVLYVGVDLRFCERLVRLSVVSARFWTFWGTRAFSGGIVEGFFLCEWRSLMLLCAMFACIFGDVSELRLSGLFL